MRTDRNVQDGDVHLVVYDVGDRRYQFARLPADRLSRFHDDLEVWIAFFKVVEEFDKLFAVVIFAGDVVASTEVHPFHLGQVTPEFLLKSREYAFEGVNVLFAQGMEMQPFDAVQQFWLELGLGHAEPGVEPAWVVNICFDGGKFRVYTDARAYFTCNGFCLEALPLGKAVVRDVVGILENLVDFPVFVCRCEYMDFFAHFFFSESSLVKAAGCGAREIFRDNGERSPKTVTFEGTYNLDACPFLNVLR